MDLAFAAGMAFRVWTVVDAARTVVVCEGHLDADALTAIEHAWQSARSRGGDASIRVSRGTTVDHAVVERLARYAVDEIDAESPFLRSWIDEFRAQEGKKTS
jgi:hypothetical protein